MRIIAERLKELRLQKNLSILELSKNLGVSDATICRWENGISDIKSDDIITISNFFDVSADYLIGLSNLQK